MFRPRLIGMLLIAAVLLPLTARAADEPPRNSPKLIEAAARGDWKTALLLIQNGSNLNSRDQDGATPLIAAAKGGHAETVDVLRFNGADVALKDKSGRTAEDWAREKGFDAIVATLKQGTRAPEGPPKEMPSTLIVSAAGESDFASIGEALKVAKPGAKIVVRPGLYCEAIVLDKDVEIVGQGARDRVIVESHEADCMLVNTDKATVRGLTLRCQAGEDKEFFGVDIPQGKLLLEDCNISSDSLAALGIRGEGTQPTVKNCWLHDSNDAGVFIYDHARPTIEGCQIFGNAAGVVVSTGGNPTVRNCQIHGNKAEGVYVYDQGAGRFEHCQIYRNGDQQTSVADDSKTTFDDCVVQSPRLAIDVLTSNVDGDDLKVDPGLSEVVLTFAQPMRTDTWYLEEVDQEEYGQFPELTEEPGVSFRDPKTFVIKVKLKPNTKYGLALNADDHLDFQSAEGVPLEPMIFYFETGGGKTQQVEKVEKTEPAEKPETTEQVDEPEDEPKPSRQITGKMIEEAYVTFLRDPTKEHFLAVRRLIIDSGEYQPISTDLNQVERFSQGGKFQEAVDRYDRSLPNLLLSPRAHFQVGMACGGAGLGTRAGLHTDMGMQCIKGILATGDGTKESPWLIMRHSDQYDVLRHLEKKDPKSKTEIIDGRYYNVCKCGDGAELWFDITDLMEHAGK